MKIPDISMISDFKAGMKCPSVISPVFSFPGIEKVLLVYNFWKWGALIFAILASFNSVIRRLLELILMHSHTIKTTSDQNEDVVDVDRDCSLSSPDDDRGEENSRKSWFEGRELVDEDWCVKGTRIHLNKQRQHSRITGESLDWPDFDSKDVVTRWDSLVVLKAEVDENANGILLRGYDPRMPRQFPAFIAEWRPTRPVFGRMFSGSIGEVYLEDVVNGVLTAGDIRNLRTPIVNVMKLYGHMSNIGCPKSKI